MIKKLLSLFTGNAAASANAPDAPLDPARIYPYLVPGTYLQHHGDAPVWPLGHDVHVVLVHDLKGAVRNVTREDLQQMGLTPDEARGLAIANLDKLAGSGAIGMKRFTGPQGKPFILMGGHWAATASILVPQIIQSAARHLGCDAVCISIPNRDALLAFPKGDHAYRDEMVAMIRKNEGDNPKLLTFGLFEYSAGAIRALD